MNWLNDLPKDRKQKLVLIVIVSVMVLAGLYQFYVAKSRAAWAANKKTIAELKPQVTDAERKQKESQANTPLKEKLLAFVKMQEPHLVTGDSFSWACREISLLAENHPVRIVSLRQGTTAPHPRQSKYLTFTTKIELAGSLDDLGVFLRDLENKFPAGEIRLLHISGGQREGRELAAALELMLLVRPEEGGGKKA